MTATSHDLHRARRRVEIAEALVADADLTLLESPRTEADWAQWREDCRALERESARLAALLTLTLTAPVGA